MAADALQLSLHSAGFGNADTYTANVTTTVKSTIGPLSNLKLSAELNATSNIHMKATSSPVVHAVYPKVNLTQSAQGGKILLLVEKSRHPMEIYQSSKARCSS